MDLTDKLIGTLKIGLETLGQKIQGGTMAIGTHDAARIIFKRHIVSITATEQTIIIRLVNGDEISASASGGAEKYNNLKTALKNHGFYIPNFGGHPDPSQDDSQTLAG